jgi:hypothetical protein
MADSSLCSSAGKELDKNLKKKINNRQFFFLFKHFHHQPFLMLILRRKEKKGGVNQVAFVCVPRVEDKRANKDGKDPACDR